MNSLFESVVNKPESRSNSLNNSVTSATLKTDARKCFAAWFQQRVNKFGINLRSFSRHLEPIISDKQTIFESLKTLVNSHQPYDVERDQYKQIVNTSSMVALNRKQADNLKPLSKIEKTLPDKYRRPDVYNMDLKRNTTIERFLWQPWLAKFSSYKRKLHRTDEPILQRKQHTIAKLQSRLTNIGTVDSSIAHGIRNPLS